MEEEVICLKVLNIDCIFLENVVQVLLRKSEMVFEDVSELEK